MLRIPAACLAILAGLFLSGDAAAQTGKAPSGSALFQQMQATGKPALIIAGSTGCVYCVEMSNEMATVPALQPLVSQILVAKIDVTSREWPVVREAFRFEERGIPAVFFVRADGELLYSNSGKPNDMERFLRSHLDKSGKQLDDKTLKAITRDARLLEQALKRRDYAKAAALVKEHGGSGSYAAPALAFDRADEHVVEQTQAAITDTLAKLEKSTQQIAAAFDLLEMPKTLEGFAQARQLAEDALSTAQSAESTSQLLNEVASMQPAREAENAKDLKLAAEVYAQVASKARLDNVRSYAATKARVLASRVK